MLLERLTAAGRADQIVLGDGRRQLTRAELSDQVLALAQRMQELQVQRLGLHADNGIAWLLADLACEQAGLVIVPLPLFFTDQQVLHVVESCGLDAVFTASPALFQSCFAQSQAGVLDGLALLRRQPARVPAIPPGTGKITFTSGSTGTPKGVCLSWAQQARQAEVLAEAVGLRGVRHLCVLPLSTLLENIAGVYAPLLAGGQVQLRPLAELGFSGSRLQQPQAFLQQLALLQPDTLILIPQLLHLLVQAVAQGWQPPPFAFIAVGGSRVAPTLVTQARALGLPVYEGYGLSECASVVSLNTPTADRPGTAGRLLPHVQTHLEDGELLVSGSAMLGYVGEPASWQPSVIATGDLCEFDADGFLIIKGRRKNLLISSYGRNIAPEWVESELLASPLFADAVVFGDAQPWCVALLSVRDPRVSDAMIAGVVAAANAQLPDYAQVQRWWRLPGPLAQQPQLLTNNGRPRRDAIAEHYAQEIAALYSTAQNAASPSLAQAG